MDCFGRAVRPALQVPRLLGPCDLAGCGRMEQDGHIRQQQLHRLGWLHAPALHQHAALWDAHDDFHAALRAGGVLEKGAEHGAQLACRVAVVRAHRVEHDAGRIRSSQARDLLAELAATRASSQAQARFDARTGRALGGSLKRRISTLSEYKVKS